MQLQFKWRMGLFEVVAEKYIFCKVSQLLKNMLTPWVRKQIASPPCCAQTKMDSVRGKYIMPDPIKQKYCPRNARSNWNSDSECKHAISTEGSEHYASITKIRHLSLFIYFLCRCHRFLQLPSFLWEKSSKPYNSSRIYRFVYGESTVLNLWKEKV